MSPGNGDYTITSEMIVEVLAEHTGWHTVKELEYLLGTYEMMMSGKLQSLVHAGKVERRMRMRPIPPGMIQGEDEYILNPGEWLVMAAKGEV